jgi:hypothetical protein
MNCVERFANPKAGFAAVMLATACAVQPACAQAGGPQAAEPSWPESDTVLDLLRADARAALAARHLERAQDWLASTASMAQARQPDAATRAALDGASDRIDVLAIYGVGRLLHAEVSVNGVLWRYRQGRRWPQGMGEEGAEPGYALAVIDPPCVRLRWQGAQVRTVCLRGGESHRE